MSLFDERDLYPSVPHDTEIVDVQIDYLSGYAGIQRTGRFLESGHFALGLNKDSEVVRVARINMSGTQKINYKDDLPVLKIDALDYFGVDH